MYSILRCTHAINVYRYSSNEDVYSTIRGIHAINWCMQSILRGMHVIP